MKIKLVILIFSFLSVAYGQKNEAGLIPFKIEKSTETQHNYFEPKFTSGLYYNHFFERFHWSTELIFAENEIHDYCRNCNDATSGEGVYKEMSFATGLGLRLHGDKISGLRGDMRLMFYGAKTKYTGRFFGGLFPVYSNINNPYYLIGGQLQYSLSYTLKSGVSFGLDAALKYSKALSRSGGTAMTPSPITQPTVLAVTFPSIRVGYRF
ncbi:MAG: hypothetical protein GQ574_11730 [Crocinitomix sp.]|nr:hypothetical protein [Crocinitomix sp.]